MPTHRRAARHVEPAAPVQVRSRRQATEPPERRPDLSGALTATIRDVVAYSRLSRSALERLEREGRLKTVRIGRTVLVRIDSLHDILGGPPARAEVVA